jgi:hypothetical protein
MKRMDKRMLIQWRSHNLFAFLKIGVCSLKTLREKCILIGDLF